MGRTLTLILLLTTAEAMASPCVKKNDSKNMCKGFSFIASHVAKSCLKEPENCSKEAGEFCRSRSASRAECIQQYGGIWMTKCYCD